MHNSFTSLVESDNCATIFSLTCQYVSSLAPGRRPMLYYLCSNQFSAEDESLPMKHNWALIVIAPGSLVLHVAANSRMRWFKARQMAAVHPISQAEQVLCILIYVNIWLTIAQ